MKLSTLQVILAMSATGMAFPTAEVAKISKRDPCNGINASPVLYHQYEGKDCPPKYEIGNDGNCPDLDYGVNKCASFCQIRTMFIYATERPFENSYCHGPFTCAVTDTTTTTITYSLTVSASVSKVLSVGVSGGYSTAAAIARARAYTITLKEGSCGYFTFVPVQKDVCGTLTYAGLNPFTPSVCDEKPTSIGNFCASEARKNSDGTVDGETIFVKTDCGTRQPLPLDQQDPVFQKPGVQLDRGLLQFLFSTWSNIDPPAPSAVPVPAPSTVSVPVPILTPASALSARPPK